MKRLYIILICLLVVTGVSAQQTKNKKRKSPAAYNKQNKENDRFLQKQWWLGLRAGTNLSKATVDKSYSVITPVTPEQAKKYDSFKQFGSQATLDISFYFKGVSISVQPTYQNARFAYRTQYQWIGGEGTPDQFYLTYKQEQRVEHAIIPVIVKYEIAGNKLRPYLQAGFYPAFLVNATKEVTVSGIDYASGGANEFRDEPVIVGAKDLFAKKHWGLVGGAGVNYNLGNVRLAFDIQYKYGMSNIVSAKNRYDNDRLSGVGDAMDDLTLNNLSFSLGCLFPMRFLENSFKSLDRKK